MNESHSPTPWELQRYKGERDPMVGWAICDADGRNIALRNCVRRDTPEDSAGNADMRLMVNSPALHAGLMAQRALMARAVMIQDRDAWNELCVQFQESIQIADELLLKVAGRGQ